MSYQGLAFRGELSEVSDDGMHFKLLFIKGRKPEEFEGRLEKACYNGRQAGKAREEFNMLDFKKGSLITAYYNVVSRKENGQKFKENIVIGITLDAVGDTKLKDERKLVAFCTTETASYGRAFGGNPQ